MITHRRAYFPSAGLQLHVLGGDRHRFGHRADLQVDINAGFQTAHRAEGAKGSWPADAIRTLLMIQYVIMPKLTLSVESAVVARAKQYARRRGISVSAMVEAYLASLARPSAPAETPPILRSLRGILKKGRVQDYRRHLVEKHR